jgi:hypothetical protein
MDGLSFVKSATGFANTRKRKRLDLFVQDNSSVMETRLLQFLVTTEIVSCFTDRWSPPLPWVHDRWSPARHVGTVARRGAPPTWACCLLRPARINKGGFGLISLSFKRSIVCVFFKVCIFARQKRHVHAWSLIAVRRVPDTMIRTRRPRRDRACSSPTSVFHLLSSRRSLQLSTHPSFMTGLQHWGSSTKQGEAPEINGRGSSACPLRYVSHPKCRSTRRVTTAGRTAVKKRW